MSTVRRNQALASELETMLAPVFGAITVEVEHSERWDRMCVTFRWAGFESLLPEERFHRLAQVIPAGFRESRLRGFVWLELGPSETVDAYLRLPRSEDVAKREKAICSQLARLRFFKALSESLGANPLERCPGDFSRTLCLLAAFGSTSSDIQDARLLFIRHGAFCDCQVLESVEPAVRRLLAGAA
jgi:hypothetical protein